MVGDCMAYGKYSDDPLEDSLFRDDVLRMEEELDEEIRRNETGTDDKKGTVGAWAYSGVFAMVFLWVTEHGYYNEGITNCLFMIMLIHGIFIRVQN